MESHELLRKVFERFGKKRAAALLGRSLAMIHKWSRPGPDGRSEVRNVLDALDVLMQGTRDRRLARWVCERMGGFFVANPLPGQPPESLSKTSSQMFKDMAELQRLVAEAELKGQVTSAEAKQLRKAWEQLKSSGEGLMQSCERGAFRLGVILWPMFWPFAWWLTTGEVPELVLADGV